jgi:HTH-type transcriptional regulator / antitoxin HigA
MIRRIVKMTTSIENYSDYYRDLINSFLPRPITNEDELNATQKQIHFILDKPQLTKDDRDYLKVLGMLVYEYEKTHEIIPEIKGVELLKAIT